MLPSRGRPGQVLLMTVGRELHADDLVRLATDANAPYVAQPMIKKLRAIHHATARHLVAGKSVKEVAALVGYTPQRVSDLKNKDPAFQNLLSYYEMQREEIDVDTTNRMQAKLVDIAELATDEIADRLEDPAKMAQIPVGELRQIAQLGLDRTVAPPKTAQPAATAPTHITFNMGTRDLQPIKEIEGKVLKKEEVDD